MATLYASIVLAVLTGIGLFFWFQRRRVAEQQLANLHRQREQAADCNALQREVDAILPSLYQSEPATQRSVGINLNMAAALFRSVYPSEKAFEAVSPQEQKEFLRRLEDAEQRFVDRDRAEAGIAVNLFKCWLCAIVEHDWQTAAEFKRHLDYFSRQPLDVPAEGMNRVTGGGRL